MQSLFERYRPRTWGDLIGHRKVRVVVDKMRETGSLGGRAFLITGPSGVGKTSIAYLIAGEVCDPDNFVELDAGDLTPAKMDELEKSLRYKCIGQKSGRAILINECHGLRKDTIRKLLDGIDSDPLFSRCVPFRLGSDYVTEFAQRAMEIATAEGLSDFGLPVFVSLAKRCACNFRMMLSEIEAGACLREDALQPA